MGLIELNEGRCCLVYCGDSCVCDARHIATNNLLHYLRSSMQGLAKQSDTKMKKLPIGNWKDMSTGMKLQTIKRLSDGVVFKLGDHVTNGTRMHGKIERFETDDDVHNRVPGSPVEIHVITDWSGIGMNLDSVSHVSNEKIVLMTPSQFQVKDICAFEVAGQRIGAQVTKITFAEGKVFYDLDIAVAPGEVTRIHGVDSAFVVSVAEPPKQMRWAEPGSPDPKPEKYVRKKAKKKK